MSCECINIVINDENLLTTLDTVENIITVIDEESLNFTCEAVGPQGPAGTNANTTITAVAGEDLSGHRAVVLVSNIAYYADSTDVSHALKVSGITTGAALTSATATIQVNGELTEPSWSWSDGPIFIGINGQLTQTVPSSGFILEVAKAITSTKILINIKRPLMRL